METGYRTAKRTFDLAASLIGLVILSPLFIILAILIVHDSEGGVFFRGFRVGLHGKEFRIFKFRSMKPDAEYHGKFSVGDTDDRITKIGHFLRNTKLDELPQLINVVKGEMSLVGPRPELRYYTDMYTEEEKVILDMKPGVTDWASMANFEQFKEFTAAEDPDQFYLECVRPLKLRLQLYYRYHRGFFSDIYCILWTLYKVITRSKRLPEDIQTIVDDYRKERAAKT